MLQDFKLKSFVYLIATLISIYLLFVVVSQLVIGYGFYKSNNEKSFSNWYNQDFKTLSFQGKIKNFFRKDTLECWLIYTIQTSNKSEEKSADEFSFTLGISKSDTLFFNSSLINRKISKDSGSFKVKIFSDELQYSEIDLPFLQNTK